MRALWRSLAGPLAWASCRAGLAGSSPAQKKQKKIESVEIKILHVLEKIYSCQFIH